MIQINKNSSQDLFKSLIQDKIEQKLSYMPEGFNQEQKKALELFQSRIYLEEIIDKTITFNKNLTWEDSTPNLKLATTAEELVEVFKLRSEVFEQMGYLDEFNNPIEGLNFDRYDTNSAVIYYENNKEVSGTIRLIFDSKYGLPSEEKYSFESKKKYTTV